MFFTATDEPLKLQDSNQNDESIRVDDLDQVQEFNQIPSSRNINKQTIEPPQIGAFSSPKVSEPKYKSLDTFILCNPNALSYQHMINYPHAFYLKYFLNKKCNVLVWNYRGYGRTKGKVTPQNIQTDAE